MFKYPDVDKIKIECIVDDDENFCYYDVTINGDTWSCETKKDCIEMIEEVLIN